VTNLNLQSEEPREVERRAGSGILLLLVLLILALGGLGWLAYETSERTRRLEAQLAIVTSKADQAAALARQALDRATTAETAARAAAEGRQVAEAQSADARKDAEAARQEASTANETAAKAQADAAAISKKAEAEVNRLEEALGQIAETRRTALGVIMNLGSDHLKFEFDKADLRPEDRELLARIAGILMTSHDYTISVNCHTDDVGSEAYNQKLSERRAQAVRDFLVKSGLPAEIFSVTGYGKTLPLVRANTEAARAKNRRVELGIVNTRIRYGVDKR